jgi:Na+-translocating ferredoxin:NAD+ oxidoreductase subunit D
MKFTFKPSPNYRNKQSTTDIMRYLTIALVIVLAYSAVWYGIRFGAQYALRVVLMAVCAVVAALITESIYFKITGSKDIKKDVSRSYGWITGIIIVLITKIDVSYYAIFVSTVIAIVFGKLVFGGFGQNIFNPAAFGEALIMNSFGSSVDSNVTSEVLSGATPLTSMAAKGWASGQSVVSTVISDVGGMGSMLLGDYATVIGGSCALLLVALCAWLIYKKVIDARLSVTYFVTVFIVSLIVGLTHGSGIQFAIFNLLVGGVLFCGVFMITDPVTTPVSIPGKYLFAICAGCLTLLIRWKASLPDGALYSILLMNMLTPAIDKLCDGSQIKDAKKLQRNVLIVSAVAVVITLAVGITLSNTEESAMIQTNEVAVVETVDVA